MSAVLRCGLCALAVDEEGQSTPSFLKSLTIDFSWTPGGKKNKPELLCVRVFKQNKSLTPK